MATTPTQIRLTADELAELDALVELLGSGSRSEAVRQSVRWYRNYMQSQFDRLKDFHDAKGATNGRRSRSR